MRFFRRSQRTFEEEIRTHLEIETDQLIAEGHAPADARHLARKRFGNVGMAQERYYDASPFAWLQDAVTDGRYALRMIRKHPGFSSSVMLISALGLVACVTTFSLVSGILLKPFPFPEQHRVFEVVMRAPGVETWGVPVAVFDSLSRASEVDAIAAGQPRGVIMQTGGAELVRMPAYAVTPGYFKLYRLKPAIGRFFSESETDAVILGFDEWRTRYGADTSVIGRTLIVDGVARRIVGVMPPGFQDHSLRTRPLWLPWILDRARPGLTVNATMRLADGRDRATVESALQRYRGPILGDRRDTVVASAGLLPVTDILAGNVGGPLLILLAAVMLVLGLVAANVATMFLAQVTSREGELGVRRALGAGRGRQLRQLVVESLTLTGVGGIAGVIVSVVLIAYVRREGMEVLPRMTEVGLDWRVATFALAVIVITGLSGGLAQAFASRDRAWTAASGRVTGTRTSTTLVVAQMALSVVLLVGAGLLVKSFVKLVPDNPGFATRNRALLQVDFVDARGKSDTAAEAIRAATARAQEAMRGVPGVEDVAVGSYMPLTGLVATADVEAPAIQNKPGSVYEYLVSDNYFAVMQMPVLAGRSFTRADGPGSERVVVVSETAARKLFGRPDVVGLRFRMNGGGARRMEDVTVVGVVNDTRTFGYNTKMRAQVYRPRSQYPLYGVTFVAATSIEPAALMPALRRALAAGAPRAVIESASDIESTVSRSVDRSRFFSIAMGLFALAAALLTGLGIYGLLSYAVTQRRREIGIRLALGATTSRIGRTVVGRAGFIALIGIPIGLATAYGMSRFMESILLEVQATDPQVFTIVPGIALLFALAAAVAPVRRVTRIDPNEAIRE